MRKTESRQIMSLRYFWAMVDGKSCILAIEPSCDDTSAAVIMEGKMLSNLVASQAIHAQYGGIVPEVASRMHQENISIVVDAARIYALGHGIEETNTCKRLAAAGPLMKVVDTEYDAWVSGFDFLQMLRLRVQVGDDVDTQTQSESPNSIKVSDLNDIDRRILRETLRVVRQLQQRMQLDYQR